MVPGSCSTLALSLKSPYPPAFARSPVAITLLSYTSIMRFSSFLAPLALIASAVAVPLAARQDSYTSATGNVTVTNSTETNATSTTFRFLGTVFCLVPTVNGTNSGPCELASQVKLVFDTDDNKTALVTVLDHSVNVTRVPVNFFANYYVVCNSPGHISCNSFTDT